MHNIRPKYTSIAETRQFLENGKETCESLVRYYLDRISKTSDLNIYVEVYADEALQRAGELDARFAQDPASVGKLFGVVVSVKDVICYEGHTITAGSKILNGFSSLFSATAIERILAEDAILIGRTNCDEFAMGSTNENSCYGPTRNAADPSRVPGGSSGGAAVSVQADTCLVALGTDTGGSVRQPASFCGVVGFKPSYGYISRHGLIAYGSSFDQVGVLSHAVADCALLTDIMGGPDEYDSTLRQSKPESLLQDRPAKTYKVAYFEEALHHPSLASGVQQVSQETIAQLKAAGHQVDPVHFEYLDYIIPAYYVLTTAEASSNLSRFDGLRFGHRTANAQSLLDMYKKSRTEGFGDEVKRRIILGTFVLSSGYYDAYYNKAQQVRRLLQDRLKAIFSEYDFILMPASPTPAWPLGEKTDDPVAMYLADIYTVLANMAGIPGISLPLGQDADTGLPIGMQFMSDRWKEGDLLAFSEAVSRERSK